MSSYEILFIAEKPSLAQAIAEALAELKGVKASKLDGFWDVGDTAVAFFYGHMAELAEPKEYGERWAKWSLDSLPIVLDESEWKLVVPDDKKGQTRKVEALARQAKQLVSAGDAGREGQLLIDEMLLHWGIDPFSPHVKRLWVQSMARKDMMAALSQLLSNSDKRSLYQAAVSRQRADWQHGMTFSRMYTLLARNSGADAKISVGRVQTPTLRLVVDRDRERIRFKPVDHYLPMIVFRHADGAFKASWVIPADYDGLDSEGRLTDKAVAEWICAKIAGKDGRVRAFKSEMKSKAPPLPFSLSALQSECGTKLGMTAKEVLDTAQALYERHKATTYPRSDSRYLPVAILKDEAPGIMAALSATPGFADIAGAADLKLRSAAWDDAKISDHHGIIPTSEFSASKLSAMSDTERKVFDIVAKAFIAQFYPAFRYRSLSADILCENEQFKAGGRQLVDNGWKRVYGAGEADDEDDKGGDAAQTLPTMAVGDGVHADSSEIASKRTSPPPAFADPTLIEAMANAHRFESNPEIKRRLKEGAGIGTEATRADTIETLIARKFLTRKGKNGLESSELGRSVIDMLPEDLKSLGLTALWEGLLGEIEKGTLDPVAFMQKQAQSITERVAANRNSVVTVKGVAAVRPLPGHGKDCALCGIGKMVTREITSKKDGKKYKCLSCTNYPACKGVEWPEPDVKPLPGHGKPCPTCGEGIMKTREVTSKKDGKKYKCLSCSNYPACKGVEWPEPDIEPLPGHGKPCTACGKGVMKTREGTSKKTGKKFKCLSCSNYPECQAIEFVDKPVEPLPGHGNPCPKCGKGHLTTKEFISKKDNKPFRKLTCDQWPTCDHGEFPERTGGGGAAPRTDVPPAEGHGKKCPKCGKGKLITKQFISKKDNKPFVKLACDQWPACDHGEFPDRKDDDGKGKSGGRGSTNRRT